MRSTCGIALYTIVYGGLLIWLVAAGSFGRYYAASFAAVLSISLGTFCYLSTDGKAIRRRVGALLGLCVALVVFFGAGHYALFLARPDLYSFSSSINEGRLIESYASDYSQALDRSKALYILALAHASVNNVLAAQQKMAHFVNPNKKQLESDEGFVVLDSVNTIRFRQDQVSSGKDLNYLEWIDVRSGTFSFSFGGDALAALVIPSSRAVYGMHYAKSSEAMRRELERLIDAVREEREQSLAKVRDLIEGRPEWNVIDFIYFATTTFTTVGYGDIVPNSTLTRVLVMLNSICGVFFAAFAFVALWPAK